MMWCYRNIGFVVVRRVVLPGSGLDGNGFVTLIPSSEERFKRVVRIIEIRFEETASGFLPSILPVGFIPISELSNVKI